MGYSRCNPFGSDQVRFGAPCVTSCAEVARQAAAQALREVAKAKKQNNLQDLLDQHPVPLPVIVPQQICSFSSAFSAGFSICAMAPIPHINRAFSQSFSPGFA